MAVTIRKKSMLIVDDEVDLVEILKSYFENNFNVITAFNGQEALFKAQNQVFDIIITDVHMPKLNGIRFLQELRKSYSPAVIIISGQVEEVQGAVDKIKDIEFMPKPFDEKEIVYKVERMLSKTDSSKDTTSQDQITVSADEWLINEGDFDDNIYWVIQGKFDVLIKNDKDEIISLGHIGKDEFIGEMGAIEQKPRSASIKALEDSIVIRITNEKFLNVFEKQPVWLQRLIKALSNRLRNSNEFKKHIE